MPKPPELRHGKDCASKSSCGSKQRRRPGRNKKSEQVPVVNFGRAGDGEHQAGEQTFVGVAFANKKEDEHAENVEPVFAAEQPPDIAIQKSAKKRRISAKNRANQWLKGLIGHLLALKMLCQLRHQFGQRSLT